MDPQYEAFEPAGFARRAAAYFIDVLVIYAYIALLFIASTAVNHILPFHEAMATSYVTRHAISFFTLTFPVILYFTLMERSRKQATLGKIALKLRVTTLTGAAASFSTLFKRNLVKFLPWEIAHTHIHLNPDFFFTGETSVAGWTIGVGLPVVAMALFAAMILVRRDRRSAYELISGTRTVRRARNMAHSDSAGTATIVTGASLLFIACGALFMPPPVAGQASASHAYITAGPSGVTSRAPSTVLIGFGGGVFVGRTYLGGSGDVTITARESNTRSSLNRRGGAGWVHAGYAIYTGVRMILYPSAGIGIAGHGASTGPDGDTRATEAYAAVSLRMNGDLYTRTLSGGPMLGWSAGFERPIGNRPDAIASGFRIGLLVGWGVNGF